MIRFIEYFKQKKIKIDHSINRTDLLINNMNNIDLLCYLTFLNQVNE